MTEKYTLQISLESDALVGSGEGWGGVIDSDVVFDEYGIPYIPARRIKGCLREAGMEINEVLAAWQTNLPSVKDLFGVPGQEDKSVLTVSNAYLQDYEKMREWLEWLSDEFKNIVSPETLQESFTSLRQQTAIDEDGIAKEHSLRISRVLHKGLVFDSEIHLRTTHPKAKTLLALAASVFRYLGKMRNRGLGKINCRLQKNGSDIIPEKINETEMILVPIGGKEHVSA